MGRKFDEVDFHMVPLGAYFFVQEDDRLVTYLKQSNGDGEQPGCGKETYTYKIREFYPLDKVLVETEYTTFVLNY